MKIIVGVCHPKDVHFWKNTIFNLKKKGHSVKIVSWDKDVTLSLLDAYGFNYEIVGKSRKNLIGKSLNIIKSDFKVFNIAKQFNPDIFLHGDPYLAHVSKILNKIHIDYCDTEHANLAHIITFPFSDITCTPSCFEKNISPKKHVIFNSYSELAYLHPNYFKPDSSVLKKLGVNIDDKLIILRFVAWEASHDLNQHGITNKEDFVKELEEYGKVLILSENTLPDNLQEYCVNIPPDSFHHLLYYATMYIGEGATIAAEAAVLGTPALYINTLRLGYLNELEDKYGLVYNFSNPLSGQMEALKKAKVLLQEENLKNKWLKKKEKMLEEKIDVTSFMTKLIIDVSRKKSSL